MPRPRQHLPKRSQPIQPTPVGFDAAIATRIALQLLNSQGFALSGVASVQPSAYRQQLETWLGAGKHGSMAYMAEEVALRLDPTGLLAGTRAFLVVADQYATRNDPPDAPRFGQGRIARYARGRNYHDVMKRRLHRVADALREQFPFAEFRSCVDTAPVMERELAVLAGLGWQGKNTMLLHPRIGSYFVLGVVATTLPLVPATPDAKVPDSCGTCTRCIDACPTQAITPYSVDARRCISYLTIEQREVQAAPDGFNRHDWLAGCDICQEVCPHNSPRAADSLDIGSPHPAYAPSRTGFALTEVLAWTEEHRRAALNSSALKRITLDMFKRNAVHAAGHWLRADPSNPHAPALRARLEHLAQDQAEPEPLRLLARRVLTSPG